MSNKWISAAICTYNRYDLLPKAIESLVHQTLGADHYKILVIDNSPDIGQAAACASKYRDIRNLHYLIERQPGLSNARNIATQLCKTPIISFIDDDAIASPEWLSDIVKTFNEYGAHVKIVGGPVDPIWITARPLWLLDSMLGNLSIVNYGEHKRFAEPREWFAGTNISFRTEAILVNGGFDNTLGRNGSGNSLLSNEEVHLVEQIRKSGGRLVYTPTARVSHLVDPRRLSQAWFRKRSAWQAVSDFMMSQDTITETTKDRWRPTIQYFNNLPPHERTIRGLIFDTEDAEIFQWQLGAIYNLTIMMLAGFNEVKLD